MSSRRTIEPHQPGLVVIVGWDNPMATYFAQVLPADDDIDDEDLVLWLGTRAGEIARPEDLVEPLMPYAHLSPAMIEQLNADRVEDVDRGPTPLQRWGREWPSR